MLHVSWLYFEEASPSRGLKRTRVGICFAPGTPRSTMNGRRASIAFGSSQWGIVGYMWWMTCVCMEWHRKRGIGIVQNLVSIYLPVCVPGRCGSHAKYTYIYERPILDGNHQTRSVSSGNRITIMSWINDRNFVTVIPLTNDSKKTGSRSACRPITSISARCTATVSYTHLTLPTTPYV